jgi:hypothetical protein
MGTLAPGTKTIAVSQLGGRVEPCELRIPDDPVFAVGEDYVLFLLQDKGTNPPNTTGSPRYRRVGVWTGTAKVVNGNIQFPPAASTGLRNHNNTDSRAFIATLQARINQLFPTRGRGR